MIEKAINLRNQIDNICGPYNIYKKTDVIDNVEKIHEDIVAYIMLFLDGNIFDLNQEDYLILSQFALEVLNDYSNARINRDMVLMIDTLDYGLRELINIVANVEG